MVAFFIIAAIEVVFAILCLWCGHNSMVDDAEEEAAAAGMSDDKPMYTPLDREPGEDNTMWSNAFSVYIYQIIVVN